MSPRYSSAAGQFGHLSEVKSSTTAMGAVPVVRLTFRVSAGAVLAVPERVISAQGRKTNAACPLIIGYSFAKARPARRPQSNTLYWRASGRFQGRSPEDRQT